MDGSGVGVIVGSGVGVIDGDAVGSGVGVGVGIGVAVGAGKIDGNFGICGTAPGMFGIAGIDGTAVDAGSVFSAVTYMAMHPSMATAIKLAVAVIMIRLFFMCPHLRP